jgi:hypothetical protein
MKFRRIFGLLIFTLCVAVGVLLGLHQGLAFGSLAVLLGTGLGLAGAIVATPVESDNNYKSWNITALDADTSGSFAHGFGSSPPDFYNIVPALSVGTSATSTWGMTAAGTQFTLTKQDAAGSGGQTAGTSIVAKVWGWLPHSAAR